MSGFPSKGFGGWAGGPCCAEGNLLSSSGLSDSRHPSIRGSLSGNKGSPSGGSRSGLFGSGSLCSCPLVAPLARALKRTGASSDGSLNKAGSSVPLSGGSGSGPLSGGSGAPSGGSGALRRQRCSAAAELSQVAAAAAALSQAAAAAAALSQAAAAVAALSQAAAAAAALSQAAAAVAALSQAAAAAAALSQAAAALSQVAAALSQAAAAAAALSQAAAAAAVLSQVAAAAAALSQAAAALSQEAAAAALSQEVAAAGLPSHTLEMVQAPSLASSNCHPSSAFVFGQAVDPLPAGRGSMPLGAQSPRRQGTSLAPPSHRGDPPVHHPTGSVTARVVPQPLIHLRLLSAPAQRWVTSCFNPTLTPV
ncbi:UNVERIFIED_CONTAM: hypothetical protein FKN15_016615 [Acipenser sinensis]